MTSAPTRQHFEEAAAAYRVLVSEAPLAAEDAALIIRWIVAGAAF